jgi:hypothetical protein
MTRQSTIKEARDYLFDEKNFSKGKICPCCDQHVKLYRRSIHHAMARGLIEAYKLGADKEFIHVPTALLGVAINSTAAEFSKLRYWNLVEEMINEDTKKRCSGYWKLTKEGVDFVLNRTRLPKYVYTYNQKALDTGFEYEDINISEALNNIFDYQELMKS